MSERKAIGEMFADAEKALADKKVEEAVALYLKCADSLRREKKLKARDVDNGVAFYVTNAFYASRFGQDHERTVDLWRKSFKGMEPDTTYSIVNGAYLFSSLKWMLLALKGKRGQVLKKHEHTASRIKACKREALRVLGDVDDNMRVARWRGKRAGYLKHGIKISDPYAYLEEAMFQRGEAETTRVLPAGFDDQSARSQVALAMMKDEYERSEHFYEAGWSKTPTAPLGAGKFYFKREAIRGTKHSVIRRASDIKSKGRIVFDTSKALADDEIFAGYRINQNGKLLAWGSSRHGSDVTTWRVRDMTKGKDLPDTISGVIWNSTYFAEDGKGLYYVSNKSGDGRRGLREPVYYHRLGSKGRDRIRHSSQDSRAAWSRPVFFDQSHVLVLDGYRHTSNIKVTLQKAGLGRRRALDLFSGRAARYEYLGSTGSSLLFIDYYRAPRGRVSTVELNDARSRVVSRSTLVDQQEDVILKGARLTRTRLVMQCLHLESAVTILEIRDKRGRFLRRVAAPCGGTIYGLHTQASSDVIYFHASSHGRPATLYKHDCKSGRTAVVGRASFKPSVEIVSRVVMVPSTDGVRVPMHLSYLAGSRPGRKTRCLLNVYGGFNIDMLPYFNYESWVFIAQGGLVAQPFLRGGGELGRDWHESARKLDKRRTYEDAEACARYLVDEGLTSAAMLAVQGASNGALTVACLLNRHPEYYGAAILQNGLYDMLKFHEHGNGWSWQSEYGSITRKGEFDYLRSYSPYHNLRAKRSLPPLLICVSLHDDRVPAWHTFKYVAALSAKYRDALRIILRVDKVTGHGGGAPNNLVEDKLEFLSHCLRD